MMNRASGPNRASVPDDQSNYNHDLVIGSNKNISLIWANFLLDQLFTPVSSTSVSFLDLSYTPTFLSNVREKFLNWSPTLWCPTELIAKSPVLSQGLSIDGKGADVFAVDSIDPLRVELRKHNNLKSIHSISRKYSDFELLSWMLVFETLPSLKLLSLVSSSKVIDQMDWKITYFEEMILGKLQKFHRFIKQKKSSANSKALPIYLHRSSIHGRYAKRGNWDILLDEISWMALDFQEEQKLRLRLASSLALEAKEYLLNHKRSSPFTTHDESWTFLPSNMDGFPIFGPPDRENPLPYEFNIPPPASPLILQPSTSLFDGPFAAKIPFNGAANNHINDLLFQHLDAVISSPKASSFFPIPTSLIMPPWSIMEDHIIIDTCLQYNFNCHPEPHPIRHILFHNEQYPDTPTKTVQSHSSLLLQHELMPPCNFISELLNNSCHHNSFVRTPLSVLRRFHYLVKTFSSIDDQAGTDVFITTHCSKELLMQIYHKSAKIQMKKPKKRLSLDFTSFSSSTSLLSLWKLKHWEKRMFIFGLIKKKIINRAGSLLTKDHHGRRSGSATLSEKKKLTAFNLVNKEPQSPHPYKVPSSLYYTALHSHPSHDSAVKKAAVGIPKHLQSNSTSASEIAIKRLQRLTFAGYQPSTSPITINSIGGGFSQAAVKGGFTSDRPLSPPFQPSMPKGATGVSGQNIMAPRSSSPLRGAQQLALNIPQLLTQRQAQVPGAWNSGMVPGLSSWNGPQLFPAHYAPFHAPGIQPSQTGGPVQSTITNGFQSTGVIQNGVIQGLINSMPPPPQTNGGMGMRQQSTSALPTMTLPMNVHQLQSNTSPTLRSTSSPYMHTGQLPGSFQPSTSSPLIQAAAPRLSPISGSTSATGPVNPHPANPPVIAPNNRLVASGFSSGYNPGMMVMMAPPTAPSVPASNMLIQPIQGSLPTLQNSSVDHSIGVSQTSNVLVQPIPTSSNLQPLGLGIGIAENKT